MIIGQQQQQIFLIQVCCYNRVYDSVIIVCLVMTCQLDFKLNSIFASDNYDQPLSPILGDLNGDNHLDMIFAYQYANKISVMLGFGNGSFGVQNKFTSGNKGQSALLVLGDINNDNQLDLVVGRGDNVSTSILFGQGDGTFSEPIIIFNGTASGSSGVSLSDFNGDGRLDIVMIDSETTLRLFLEYSSNGTFEKQIIISIGNGSFLSSIVTGDINNDYRADIVFTNPNGHQVGVLLGNGDGTFQELKTTQAEVYSTRQEIAMIDLNHDDKLDLAFVDPFNFRVGIFLGKGDGTFETLATFSSGYNGEPNSIFVDDFNQDKHLDIAVSNTDTDNVCILLGNGDGTFQSVLCFSTEINTRPLWISAGDINSDEKSDIIVIRSSIDDISSMLNLCF